MRNVAESVFPGDRAIIIFLQDRGPYGGGDWAFCCLFSDILLLVVVNLPVCHGPVSVLCMCMIAVVGLSKDYFISLVCDVLSLIVFILSISVCHVACAPSSLGP